MGGSGAEMMQTRWSQIFLVQQGRTQQRQQALGSITQQYWKPVYSFLRCRGYDNDRAKDLTQGFFTDVILGRQLVDKADRNQGKFRSYLLSSLGNYVNDQHRRRTAASRRPEKGLVSLEGVEANRFVSSQTDADPERTFHRVWASALLSTVLRELEAQCRSRGQAKHWEVFRHRHLLPILEGVRPASYARICRQCDIETPAKATTMNVTVKRKFESLLRRRVRQSVDSDEQVEDEIRDLMNILSQMDPGSTL
jgi:DNA-directed RNA polymerase specialized sigma24 family protein